MGKTDRPLAVEIPRPGSERPAWSRVGAIGLAGFVIGIAWPRIAGVTIGPSVPGDLRAKIEGTPAPPTSAAASASAAPAVVAPPAPSAAASAEPAVVPANQELVVVGPGKITRCYLKKKKIEDCGQLLFDPIAIPKLNDLAKCPSAMGLEGKMTLGFEVNFDKKEIHVAKTKKVRGMPSTTVNGIVQCAAREFGNASLDEVPHTYDRYTLAYSLNFYKPGKHPAGAGATDDGDKGDDESAAGATTNETEVSGNAVIASDSVSLRKEAKGKEKVGRLVRGTKVKILAKQNDWYKVESGSNVGWVYRTAIGL